MSKVDDTTSTQYDDHSGPELSSGTLVLTPSTGSSHSQKAPEVDFEKGSPVENELAQTVCSEDSKYIHQQLILDLHLGGDLGCCR